MRLAWMPSNNVQPFHQMKRELFKSGWDWLGDWSACVAQVRQMGGLAVEGHLSTDLLSCAPWRPVCSTTGWTVSPWCFPAAMSSPSGLDHATASEPLAARAGQRARAETAPLYQELNIGDHIRSTALQTYLYLGEKVRSGVLQRPKGARLPSSFGNFHKEPVGSDEAAAA
jgi:hypothetical protein